MRTASPAVGYTLKASDAVSELQDALRRLHGWPAYQLEHLTRKLGPLAPTDPNVDFYKPLIAAIEAQLERCAANISELLRAEISRAGTL